MKSTAHVHTRVDPVHLVYLICLVESNKRGRQDIRETNLSSCFTRQGSTPLSRTVEWRVVPPAAACPVFAPVTDCGTIRCSQRYRPWLRLLSDSGADSRVHV